MNSHRMCLASLATLVTILFGCSPSRTPLPTQANPFPIERTETFDTIARAYVRVALALGERDPDSLDFAVVDPSLRDAIHRSYPTYEAIDRETTRLLISLRDPPPANQQQLRAQFLVHQLDAIHARILMLQGHTLDFAAEAHILFQTIPLPDDASAARIALRKQILSLLPPASPNHTPATRYALYDRQFLVPRDRLPAVMTAALTACRRQTLRYIALPPEESVDLNFVVNQPWSAFSRFHGNAHSTISINTGFPITVDQALELACHEGYPGHHVFNTLREIALAQNKHWPEAEVQPTFSPQSYLSESAAAFAPRLAFTLPERINIERDILFPLAGLPAAKAERYVTISGLVRRLDTAEPHIAQQYLDGQLEFVRAARQLQNEALMEHGEATLLYLNEFRSYMLAYTDGPRRITARLAPQSTSNEPGDRRSLWQRYPELTSLLALPPTSPADKNP